MGKSKKESPAVSVSFQSPSVLAKIRTYVEWTGEEIDLDIPELSDKEWATLTVIPRYDLGSDIIQATLGIENNDGDYREIVAFFRFSLNLTEVKVTQTVTVEEV